MIGVFVEWDWLPSRQMRKVPVGHVITESGCWEWAGCLGCHVLPHPLACKHEFVEADRQKDKTVA